jgi:uncharacterized protein
MRVTTGAVALMLLGSGSAGAFNCSDLSLSSRFVICSDPELINLADERQKTFDETIARLGADQRKELLADQQSWVKAYATACGVPLDKPPPNPVPPIVKDCFKRVAEARLADLKAYSAPINAAQRTDRSPEIARAPGASSSHPALVQAPTASQDNTAGTVTVQVTGSGPTIEEARTDAIRQALQQTITQLIVVDRAIKNDRIVRDNILSTMNGYIEKFQPGKIEKANTGFVVTASITVSASRIENFIGVSAGSGTSIDAPSLLAESNRELAQRKARGEILDRVLQGFPVSGSDIKITGIKPADTDPTMLAVDFALTYNPTFLKALSETLRVLSSAACDVESDKAYKAVQQPAPWLIPCSPGSADPIRMWGQPKICVFYTSRTACFALNPGDYCTKCIREQTPGAWQLRVAYGFINGGNSELKDEAKCRVADVLGLYPSVGLRTKTLIRPASEAFVAALDVSAVRGRFLVPKSSVNLETVKYAVAAPGFAQVHFGSGFISFFDILNNASNSRSDLCSVLDPAIERTVAQQ